jgi:hypothetical protein
MGLYRMSIRRQAKPLQSPSKDAPCRSPEARYFEEGLAGCGGAFKRPVLDPATTRFQAPSPRSLALPHLPVCSGFACLQCDYVAPSMTTIAKHYQEKHKESNYGRGRRPKAVAVVAAPRWRPVSCQRLSSQGTGSHFFAVVSLGRGKLDNIFWNRCAVVHVRL